MKNCWDNGRYPDSQAIQGPVKESEKQRQSNRNAHQFKRPRDLDGRRPCGRCSEDDIPKMNCPERAQSRADGCFRAKRLMHFPKNSRTSMLPIPTEVRVC